MLVVTRVIVQGTAHKKVENGDVLLRVNGQLITRFYELESLLDDNVGQSVTLEVGCIGLSTDTVCGE